MITLEAFRTFVQRQKEVEGFARKLAADELLREELIAGLQIEDSQATQVQ